MAKNKVTIVCNCECHQNGSDADAKIWKKNFTQLKQQLRQILYEKNIGSNPAVDDQWIIDELRKLLQIENSPHRHLNFFDQVDSRSAGKSNS